MSYYLYKKEDSFCAVSDKPQPMPIIQIVQTLEQAEIMLKNYLINGRDNIIKHEKYHYGMVIGKVNDTVLKCVECIEYKYDFNYGKYNLNIQLDNDNIKNLPYVEVLSDEANVSILEKETKGFINYNIGIWWHHNRRQGSPI